MNIKKIHILIFVISIAGLAFIQYQYLKIGLNLAKVQFNQKMGLVINNVKQDLQDPNQLTFLVGKAITKDSTYFKLSIDSVQDASRYYMNDFLKDKLLQQGIKSDFSYTLYSRDSTDYLKSPKLYATDDNLLKYPIVLDGYLPSLVKKRLILELQFKNIHNYFLSQLNGLTIPSLIFLSIILFIIFWMLKSFYWQRNIILTTNEFINNLTHELKTPVFSIGVATKILQNKISDNHQKDLINIIRTQVDKLKNQIDKVLELARLEDKKGLIKKTIIDFKPNLTKLVDDFEQLAIIENIDFTKEIEDDTYILNCEPTHLENAINNLLENAKKYSTNHPKVTFTAHKNNTQLIIKVSDNGIGISENDKKRIFDKFFRVSSGDIHNVKGYGLGLNYIKRIIKLHKGKIIVNSTLGKGSEFIITLPLNTNGK